VERASSDARWAELLSGGSPSGFPDEQSVARAAERLLDVGRHDPALRLIVAAAQHHEGFAPAATVAAGLLAVHFPGSGADPGPLRAPEPSQLGAPPRSDVTLDAARVALRLRPHSRGTLGAWECTILKGLLP
jgi:hypothetical protein